MQSTSSSVIFKCLCVLCKVSITFPARWHTLEGITERQSKNLLKQLCASYTEDSLPYSFLLCPQKENFSRNIMFCPCAQQKVILSVTTAYITQNGYIVKSNQMRFYTRTACLTFVHDANGFFFFSCNSNVSKMVLSSLADISKFLTSSNFYYR